MDNASKALIMAGAILIAVMLISLGVLLYNRAQDIAKEATESVGGVAVQAFNEQFTPYLGSKVNASTVRSLYQKMVASNAASNNQIKVTYSANATPGTSAITLAQVNALADNKSFKVVIGGYNSQGYITTINVTTN